MLNSHLKVDVIYLDNNSIFKSKLRINLAYFGMAIAKVQLLNLLMYLFLTDRRGTLSIRIQSAVHEGRMLIVEPNRKIYNNYCGIRKIFLQGITRCSVRSN